MTNFADKVSFIWSVADLLRGPYKPAQYKDVMLPLTVLRRLDCVLAPTKDKVLAKLAELKGGKVADPEPILNRVAKASFHNTSKLDFAKLLGEQDKIAANLTAYIKAFSSQVRDIFDKFDFEPEIARLDENNRLFLVVKKFAELDLHPDRVLNTEMGYIFEELIRRFNEAANETAGDHFTPREVIRLMVNLLFAPDRDLLIKKGIVRTLFDPACGTGGMLAVADEYLHELNPDARLEVFGQDHNPESYAVCGSDMLIKGHAIDHIVFGSSFTKDGFPRDRFDYLLANPPFGVEWKPEQEAIEKEHETLGYDGRFGAGLPRINDGSFLFLQHMISKMNAVKDGGTRLTIDPLAALAETQDQLHQRLIEMTPTDSDDLHNAWQATIPPAPALTSRPSTLTPRLPDQFLILITCTSEQHQANLLDRFHTEGLTCKPLLS